MIFVSNCIISSTTDRFGSAAQIILMQGYFVSHVQATSHHQFSAVCLHGLPSRDGFVSKVDLDMYIKDGNLLQPDVMLLGAAPYPEHLC